MPSTLPVPEPRPLSRGKGSQPARVPLTVIPPSATHSPLSMHRRGPLSAVSTASRASELSPASAGSARLAHPSSAGSARLTHGGSSSVEQHLLRLRAAREAALIKAGGLSASHAIAERARRTVIAQVDAHTREVQARREAQIKQVYGHVAAAGLAGKIRPRAPGSGLELSRTLLGEGATSRVYLGRFGMQRSEVAVKVVRKEGMSAEELGWIRDEISIHRGLRHMHVCTLHGAMEAPATITIVLALCRGGSLCDTMGRALETRTPISEDKVHRTLVQLCGALHYCHRHGVVHRDIKLDNLCWSDDTERSLQLIDFGCALQRCMRRRGVISVRCVLIPTNLM